MIYRKEIRLIEDLLKKRKAAVLPPLVPCGSNFDVRAMATKVVTPRSGWFA
jgi:hypothetical protein